jgi:drug/metabolite transporter (DMT)-like permease
MRRWLLYGLIILFSVIWSSGFIAGKVAITELDPLEVLALRFLLSVALLLPFCVRQAGHLRNQQSMRAGIQLGVLNNALYLGLTFSPLRFIRPQLVVIVVSTAPFLTTILAAMRSLERINIPKVVGIAMGFGGVLVITGVGSLTASDITGLALALTGTAAFSIATVYFRGKAAGLSVLQLNFWQSVAGAVALIPVAVLLGRKPSFPSLPTAIAILYLSVVVTIGGMVLWLFLIRKSGAASASAYHLLNPLFGVLLSHFILKTPIRQQDLVGAAAIAAGLLIAISARNGGNNDPSPRVEKRIPEGAHAEHLARQ